MDSDLRPSLPALLLIIIKHRFPAPGAEKNAMIVQWEHPANFHSTRSCSTPTRGTHEDSGRTQAMEENSQHAKPAPDANLPRFPQPQPRLRRLLALLPAIISAIGAISTLVLLPMIDHANLFEDFRWVVLMALLAFSVSYIFFDAIFKRYQSQMLEYRDTAQQYSQDIAQFNEKFLQIISEISSFSNWNLAAYRTANEMAINFAQRGRQVTVNILSLRANELYFDASSAPAGQDLAAAGYHFPGERGVTGWVVSNDKPCYINDVNHDPQSRYFAHHAFPDVLSELAVPIKYGDNKVVGVIDLQSGDPLTAEDLSMLQAVAVQLGGIYRRLDYLNARKKLADISVSLAKRVISIHDLGVLLKETGIVAREVLGADVVSYYYVNPSDGLLKGPYSAGELLHPAEAEKSPEDLLANEILNDVMARRDIQYIEQAENFGLVSADEEKRQPFVNREKIKSYVAIPLISDNSMLGLMFVNFRSHQTFNQEFKELIEIFSSLSSLAIQNCQGEEITALVRHNQLVRDLHDTVQHRLLGAERAINTLLNSQPGCADWKTYGAASMNYVVSARKIIYNLECGEEIFTLKTILENIRWHAHLIRAIYKIDVNLSLPEVDPSVPILTWMGNQIEYAIEEVLYNAVQHSQTTSIEILAELIDSDLSIRVVDHGLGFDAQDVLRGLGLDNIRQRVETYLNGSLQIDSHKGLGTEISIRFPVIIEFMEAA